MGLLYDLTWEYCGHHGTSFGVRWDGIPLPAAEAEKELKDLPSNVAMWRDPLFSPELKGETALLLELRHGQQWFLMNYHKANADSNVVGWEGMRSLGKGEGVKGLKGGLVREEGIAEQYYSRERTL